MIPLRLLFADRAFGRSLLTSALATLSDFILANGLVALGARVAWSTAAGCTLGGAVAFATNRQWAFDAREGSPIKQSLRFLFVWATNALLSTAGVALAVRASGLGFATAWIVVRGLVYVGWNYPLLRFYVFRPRRPRA